MLNKIIQQNQKLVSFISKGKYQCSSHRQQYLKQLSQNEGETITCKAAVAWEPKKPLDVTDVQVAPPQKGEIRLKVISNALCHTDVYTLNGQDPEGLFPSILGHEATAVVESIGRDVESVKIGDVVIPCYTPECGEPNCIFCQSKKTNLCPKIRSTQGQGLMPDGTSRFSKNGQVIHHFMGCSTFSEYTVISEISAAKINDQADLNKVCVLGCGVSTGLGAVWNNCNVQPGTTVVVFGLGAVGLAVVQAAQIAGARRIVAVDTNSSKKAISMKFGATDFVNPLEVNNDVRSWLLQQEQWGYDYTFDCTGNTEIMRLALEVAHRGWGESCVIGVAAAGHELSTRPFQLVTGRVWKGTAFGGWKSRTDVPQLVNKVVTGEIPIDDYITHNFKGLEKVNESIDALHSGDCLRAVVQISDPYEQENQSSQNKEQPQVISNNRTFNGQLKRIKHWSESCQSYMNFSIYLPDQERGEKLPGVLYYLSGLTCSDENARTKSAFQEYASKHKIAVVFPDTSPRDTNIEGVTDDWAFGEGAGFYLDAQNSKYSKNFNMYSYISEELPSIVNNYFPVDQQKSSICGHSMGGHGALVIGLRNPEKYQSISAFAPICNPSKSRHQQQIKQYLGEQYDSQYQLYDAVELVKNYNSNKKLKLFIDQGTKDEFLPDLKTENLKQACIEKNYPYEIRYQKDYDHAYFFISTFIQDHIQYHAKYLNE